MARNEISVPQWLAVQVRVDSTRKKHAEFFRDNPSRTHHAVTTFAEDFLAAFPQAERAYVRDVARRHLSFISAAKLFSCGKTVRRLIYPAAFYPDDFDSLCRYGASETQSRDAFESIRELADRRLDALIYCSRDQFLIGRALLLNPAKMHRDFLLSSEAA
jgi:hypothetical protein